MSVPALSQSGSTTRSEYPKRVFWNGVWVTLFTDAQIERLNEFRIDYSEAMEKVDTFIVYRKRDSIVIEGQRKEILGLRSEIGSFNMLMDNHSKQFGLLDIKIVGLENQNKKLRKKTGILGGAVAVLGTVAGILIITK